MSERIKSSEVLEMIKPYFDFEVNTHNNDIMRAVENVNSCWTFPEDMCESRMDWESLRDMVTTANDGISCLVGILGKVLEENKMLKENK